MLIEVRQFDTYFDLCNIQTNAIIYYLRTLRDTKYKIAIITTEGKCIILIGKITI